MSNEELLAKLEAVGQAVKNKGTGFGHGSITHLERVYKAALNLSHDLPALIAAVEEWAAGRKEKQA